MNDFLLSQAEIDALMDKPKLSQSAFDQHLTDYFQPINLAIEKQFYSLLNFSVTVDGFYVEKHGDFSSDIFAEAYIVPIEFGDEDTFVVITPSDAALIAKQFNISLAKALVLIGQAFAAGGSDFFHEKAALWNRHRVYQPVLVQGDEFKGLAVGPTHRARFNLCLETKSIELFWLLSETMIGKILAKEAPATDQALSGGTSRKFQGKKRVNVQTFDFTHLAGGSKKNLSKHKFDLINDVSIEITAELGQSALTLGEIMDLKAGDFVKLNKAAGEPADVFAMGQPIAKAEVTIVDEHFGLRVVAIDPMKDLII